MPQGHVEEGCKERVMYLLKGMERLDRLTGFECADVSIASTCGNAFHSWFHVCHSSGQSEEAALQVESVLAILFDRLGGSCKAVSRM
jgi:hypothetical protein